MSLRPPDCAEPLKRRGEGQGWWGEAQRSHPGWCLFHGARVDHRGYTHQPKSVGVYRAP